MNWIFTTERDLYDGKAELPTLPYNRRIMRVYNLSLFSRPVMIRVRSTQEYHIAQLCRSWSGSRSWMTYDKTYVEFGDVECWSYIDSPEGGMLIRGKFESEQPSRPPEKFGNYQPEDMEADEMGTFRGERTR